MKSLLKMKFVPASYDLALLLLRILAMLSLFIKHGIEKIFTFSAMVPNFPDPIGIGRGPSLVIAMVGDAICSILILIGLGTRWAALISLINLMVAWIFVHHFKFFGKNTDHVEMVFLYVTVLLTLFVSGAGKYSIDNLIGD